MENRIEEHKRKATSPETNDALAIVAAEMAVSTEKDTEENAKAILEQSINEDEMHTDWEGEPVLTGNPLGVNCQVSTLVLSRGTRRRCSSKKSVQTRPG